MPTLNMAAGKVPGLLSPGNIDLAKRPVVKNADGSISTVRSMSFNEDGREILVPTVSPDGRIMSEDEAIDLYHKTGQNLGMFDTPDNATAYAQTLHNQQAQMYSQPEAKKPVILNIQGKRVKVDDSFLQLSPEEQNRTVEEIAAQIGVSQPESQQSQDLRSELSGMTQNPQTQDNGGIAGALDAFGRGTAKMAGMGFMDEIGAGARWAGGKIFPWQPEVTYDQALAEVRGDDKRVAAAHPVADVAGKVTGALGLAGGIARSGLSPTMAVANRGGGLLATSAASAAEGGALGAVQGFGEGEGTTDRLKKAANGGVSGLVIGAALPSVVSLASNAFRRLVSPNTIGAERQALVDTLGREGVDVTAGQATGSNGLRYAESEIGGQAAANTMERQGEQFTSAALRRAGANAPRATPEVIDTNFRRIGQVFDNLAANNQLVPDRRLAQDLRAAWTDYASLVPQNARAPVVENMIRDIAQAAGNGPMDGAVYQAARSRLDRLARGAAADPQLQEALFGIRNSLDNAMERTLMRTNPSDLGAWRTARRQYRNMLVLERAATGAGENAAQGIISPSQLRNATVSVHGRRNYARGMGDFAELARAGEGVMKPMPNSGTAGRFRAQNVGTGIMSTLGAVTGTSVGGPYVGLAGAAVGALTPRVLGQIMMSPGGQAYLRNQLLAGNLPAETRAMIVEALNTIGSSETPKANVIP